MKFFLIVSFLLSASVQASKLSECGFLKGSINLPSGQVSQSFRPKIVQAVNLSVDQTERDIVLSSLFDGSIFLLGVANCDASRSRDGFSCYMVDSNQPFRPFYVYLDSSKPKIMNLVQDISVVGGGYQQDEYRCRN